VIIKEEVVEYQNNMLGSFGVYEVASGSAIAIACIVGFHDRTLVQQLEQSCPSSLKL